MESLKKLIQSAENKQQGIDQQENLSACIEQGGNLELSGNGGYYNTTFRGERKEKILSLLNEFIKEDKAALEPLTTKLNLISDLVKGE